MTTCLGRALIEKGPPKQELHPLYHTNHVIKQCHLVEFNKVKPQEP